MRGLDISINYMKTNNMIEFEKNKTTKAIISNREERLFIRQCLKRLDASYLDNA